MKETRKAIRFWITGVGLLFFLAVGMLYSFLVLMPTGYEEMQKSAAQARQWMNRGQRVETSVRRNASADVINDEARAKLIENFVAQLRQESELRPYIFFEGMKEPKLGAAILPMLNPEQREDLIHRIKQAIRNYDERIEVRPPTSTARDAASIHEYLDAFDECQLDSDQDQSNADLWASHLGSDSYPFIAAISIARASMRGDQERAMRLIDAYFKRLREMRAARLQDATTEFPFVGHPAYFFDPNMAMLPHFPPEGWDHIQRGLEGMQFSAEELAGLRQIRFCNWHDDFVDRINGRRFEMKNNSWHRAAGGFFEGLINKALNPIAMKQVEITAITAAQGDVEELNRQRKRLRKIFNVMNVYGLDRLKLDEKTARDYEIGFANYAVHEKRARPYLQMFMRHDSSDTLAVERFATLKYGSREDETLNTALRNFQQKHRHEPDSVEDVDEVLNSAKPGEDWRTRIVWHESRRFILFWKSRTVEIYSGNRPARKASGVSIELVPTDFLLVTHLKNLADVEAGKSLGQKSE